MNENDYPGHYRAFVKDLSQKPGQTLQNYCQENGVVWRRLYDCMRRNHISLKMLYIVKTTSEEKAQGRATLANMASSMITDKDRIVKAIAVYLRNKIVGQ